MRRIADVRGGHYNGLQAFACRYRRRVPHKLYKQLLLLDGATYTSARLVSTICWGPSGPRKRVWQWRATRMCSRSGPRRGASDETAAAGISDGRKSTSFYSEASHTGVDDVAEERQHISSFCCWEAPGCQAKRWRPAAVMFGRSDKSNATIALSIAGSRGGRARCAWKRAATVGDEQQDDCSDVVMSGGVVDEEQRMETGGDDVVEEQQDGCSDVVSSSRVAEEERRVSHGDGRRRRWEGQQDERNDRGEDGGNVSNVNGACEYFINLVLQDCLVERWKLMDFVVELFHEVYSCVYHASGDAGSEGWCRGPPWQRGTCAWGIRLRRTPPEGETSIVETTAQVDEQMVKCRLVRR